jgi:hypothetical protein
MTGEAIVCQWGPFTVIRNVQGTDPFGVHYTDETPGSAVLRTASLLEMTQLLDHLESESQEGELADLVEFLRRQVGRNPSATVDRDLL